MPVLFCNVSWMKEYGGRNGDDPPLGGGGFPRANGYCGEECNFVPGDDGYVYGHFETIKGEADRQVRIERLGAAPSDKYVDGVDVVWTAPERGNDPRVVVGWYRDARVYRQRQRYDGDQPSDIHWRDDIASFMTKARADQAFLLKPEQRTLRLSRGTGWSGQASWWYAEDTADKAAKAFVRKVKAMIAGQPVTPVDPSNDKRPGGRAGAASSRAYSRYVSKFEVAVSPRHHLLQKRFLTFLRTHHPTVTFPPAFRDDLRYEVKGAPQVMVEIKPADPANVRFAIRTAIGQLLDYQQHQQWTGRRLIVVGAEVTRADDLALALDNGFGLAWEVDQGGFELRWPRR